MFGILEMTKLQRSGINHWLPRAWGRGWESVCTQRSSTRAFFCGTMGQFCISIVTVFTGVMCVGSEDTELGACTHTDECRVSKTW